MGKVYERLRERRNQAVHFYHPVDLGSDKKVAVEQPVSSGHHEDKLVVRVGGRLMATPLMVVLVCVEVTDVIFAVDSIPVIFAVTLDPFIIYTSNVFAIMGLRSLYFVLGRMMGMFHYLKGIFDSLRHHMCGSSCSRCPAGAAKNTARKEARSDFPHHRKSFPGSIPRHSPREPIPRRSPGEFPPRGRTDPAPFPSAFAGVVAVLSKTHGVRLRK